MTKQTKKFIFNETNNLQIGPLGPDEVGQLLKDGRIAGLLAKALLQKWIGAEVDHNNDLLLDGKKYDVKTVSKQGANLLPSYQIGSGRCEIPALAERHQSARDGVVFIDITKSPIFQVHIVESVHLPKNKKLSYSQFLTLVD